MTEVMELADKAFKTVWNMHKDLEEIWKIINIFSYYMGCLFTFLIISFDPQKFL